MCSNDNRFLLPFSTERSIQQSAPTPVSERGRFACEVLQPEGCKRNRRLGHISQSDPAQSVRRCKAENRRIVKGGKRGSVLCVFAEQAGERASDHQGHAAEGQTDGGQPVHAGLRQGMCVLNSGQNGVSGQYRGVRLCVLHRRQLRSAGQYGRVGILFLNDLVVAVVAGDLRVNMDDIPSGDHHIMLLYGLVAVIDLGLFLRSLDHVLRLQRSFGGVVVLVGEGAAVLLHRRRFAGEEVVDQVDEADIAAAAGARGIVFTPLVLLGGAGIMVGVAEVAGLARIMACIRVRRGIGGRVFAVGLQAVHIIVLRRADVP